MKYCAFLRGINVNGITLKMADVCKVFSDAGLRSVSSVLATGNIIFSSEKTTAELKTILEKALSERFGYEAFIFVKSEEEVSQMTENMPFEKDENCHIYIFTGVKGIEDILLDEFEAAEKNGAEKGKIAGKNFYWQVPKGNTLDSSFGKILGRKTLKDKMTSRNVNTLEKILKKFE